MAGPGIKLTAKSFQAIEKSLDSIIGKAEEATKKITAMFDIDGSKMATLNTLRKINWVLYRINQSMNKAGGGKGGGGGGRRTASGGAEDDGGMLGRGTRWLTGRLQKSSFQRWLNSMAFKTAFGGPGGLGSSLRGGNFLGLNLSKFGPGSMGLMAKYRVFQKPFPGSDRNIFSLGDLAASGQNMAFGAGSALETAFRSVTGSAIAVNKVFNGLTSTIISVVSPTLGALVGGVGDMFIGMFESMSKAIAGVIGSLTNMATALLGFATRAVEAASNLTEAINAARVIAGPESAARMVDYAMSIQRQYGLSQTDSMKVMGRMAGMMRNLGGFTQQESGDTSMQLYRAAVDIGSVMNKSIEDVGMQLMSGFAGRLTPLRRSAIGITAQQLDQQAKARGITKPGVRTDLQARARQFVEEFSRQAGLFTGDLERTQFEFANQRRKFLGQFEALFVTVGRILEPFAKAILVAANDLMGMVLDIMSPFAKTMKDNMVEMTVTERLAESIKAFAYYVVWTKNAIVELVKRIYEARTMIVDFAMKIANAIGTLAIGLVKYSVSVVDVFVRFITGLNSIIPVLALFAESLKVASSVVEPSDRYKNFAKNREEIGLLDKRIEMMAGGKLVKQGNPFAVAELERLKGRREELLGGSPTNSLIPGFGKDINDAAVKLKGLVGSLNAEPLQQDIAALLDKIKPVESFANPLAPSPEMGGGRLVQYFNPAAFRDAIQERDTTPMQDTAKNTAEMVNILKDIATRSVGPNGVLVPRPSPLPLVTAP